MADRSARRVMPVLHNPDHEAPFDDFVQAMADELAANAHKGDRPGWLTMTPREALGELSYHVGKLAMAMRGVGRGGAAPDPRFAHLTPADVREYAADTANCALMVADICGVVGNACPECGAPGGYPAAGPCATHEAAA